MRTAIHEPDEKAEVKTGFPESIFDFRESKNQIRVIGPVFH